MSELMDNVPLSSASPAGKAKEKTGKKFGLKINFSGLTTKDYSLKFDTNHQGMKPFELLEELCKLRGDETLSRDEKYTRIERMLETEK